MTIDENLRQITWIIVKIWLENRELFLKQGIASDSVSLQRDRVIT